MTDAVAKTGAVNKSDAKVLIKLGNCDAKIDVDAASLTLFKGDGDLSMDVDLSKDLFAQTGDGTNNITGSVGGNVSLFAGEVNDGEQNTIDLVAGGSATMQLGITEREYNENGYLKSGKINGQSDSNITLTANSIDVSMGEGALKADLTAVEDITVKANNTKASTHDVTAVTEGDVDVRVGDGNATMNLTGDNIINNVGDGDLTANYTANGDVISKSGTGKHDINGSAGGDAVIDVGVTGTYVDANGNAKLDDNGNIMYAYDTKNSSDTNITFTANTIDYGMGDGDLTANLKSDNWTQMNAGDGNHDVNINAGGDIRAIFGDGNAAMNLNGANITNQVGNGDHVLNYDASGNLIAQTGEQGKSVVEADVDGHAIIITKDGDDTINANVKGMAFINAGSTDNDAESDNDNVKLTAKGIDSSTYAEFLTENLGVVGYRKDKDGNEIEVTAGEYYGTDNYVSLGNGKDTAAIFANDVSLNKNNGELLAGVMGDDAYIRSDADKNTVAYYGDHYTTSVLGSADNDIRTMDFAIRDGSDGREIQTVAEDGTITRQALKDTVTVRNADGEEVTLNAYDKENKSTEVEWFKDNFKDAFEAETWDISSSKREIVYQTKDDKTMKEAKAEIIEKYNLSDKEAAILESVDLTETITVRGVTVPRYTIAKSPKKSTQGNDVYVVIKNDGWVPSEKDPANFFHGFAVSNGECIAFDISDTTVSEYADVQTIITKYQGANNYMTTGVTDSNVYLRGEMTGDLKVNLTAYGAGDDSKYDVQIVADTAKDEADLEAKLAKADINIKGTHIDTTIINEETVKEQDWATRVYVEKATWNSPLILDMNGDNKISTADGIGVDTDGDGTVDGAATGGDKMLAMSDMNGDGTINAAEVFGNNTISPFTKQKLNAANGFEALRMIAEEAEENTNIKCINNGQVDMAALAQALATVDVQLGLISDENNTTLEELTGVKTISTSYEDKLYEDGEKREFGTFTTTDGEIRRIDDVWFETKED